jgi:lipopolysaccharide export system permease protein
LSFSENSVDLARARSGEADSRYRNAQERTLGELLRPDPAEHIPDRDLKRFIAEAHQRLTGPLTAMSYALVALATALTGQFRRHGGSLRLFTGIAVVVALLAFGLTAGNLAARTPRLIPLIWLNTLLPGLISAWVLSGAPGWPHHWRFGRRSLGATTP